MALYSNCVDLLLMFLSILIPHRYINNIGIFLKTLPRDIRLGIIALKVLIVSFINIKILNQNAVSLFKNVVKKYPNKPCFLFEDQVWTFKQVNEYSNKISHIFQRAGLKKGDIVALAMGNRPEYVCIWLGLAKIGVTTAFINTNLRSQPLVHSIAAATSKIIIYSSDLAEALSEVRGSLEKGSRLYRLDRSGGRPEGGQTDAVLLDDLLSEMPCDEPKQEADISCSDHLVYVFTSGTTGLPKAAIVPHTRYVLMTIFAGQLIGLRAEDIVYCPLPLYHSAGGLLGVGAALGLGATVVLRSKFSASAFIPDVIRHKATVAQYIGEICRYVLAQPELPTDSQHKLRLIVGNGLRPAIWRAFVARFKVSQVREIYGSTEGNLQFVNLDNRIGAIGVIPRFLPFSRYIGAIIKVDADTMQPIRGVDGLCIECKPDEPGMFIGLIPRKNTVKEFHGYLDKEETKKKYIFDVFKKGDKAFMSGDIIIMDELGYLYFKDRTGDTFRWKGENVSTSEVEAIISTIVGLRDVIVYGVQIGDLEGRAGMAAILDPAREVDLSVLLRGLEKSLPRYAQPLFIRLLPAQTHLTGTFKLKKLELTREGFNPAVVSDPLYFRHGKEYVPLTSQLYNQIINGKIPL